MFLCNAISDTKKSIRKIGSNIKLSGKTKKVI